MTTPDSGRAPARLATRGWVLLLLAAGACDHSPPFGTETQPGAGPFSPTAPVRLTFNIEEDVYPQWLPGDTGIVYGNRYGDPHQRDRCLAVVPPGGGTRLREWCKTSFGGLDSTEVLGPAAISPGGRVVYEYHQNRFRGPPAGPSFLAIAQVTDPFAASAVHPLPFTTLGLTIEAIRDPRWIDETHLVYIAVHNVPTVSGVVPTGRDVILVDLSDGTPRLSLVANTAYTSSLAVAEDGDLVTTVAGDPRVYRRGLAELPALLFDFGAAGIARDVSLRGSLLTAVVGGGVRYLVDPNFGPLQSDIGGRLLAVDLDLGQVVFVSPPSGVTPSPVPNQNLFRRAVLGPGGSVVVEGHPFVEIITGVPPNLQVDTLISGTSDLWRVAVR